MKTTRDLFILGAGASTAYGFPVGRDLKALAIERLKPNNGEERTLVNQAGAILGYDVADVSDFITRLASERHARDKSIDEFVEATRHLDRAGKITEIARATIAILIAQLENEELLYPKDEDWYENLFERMYEDRRTPNEFFTNRIGFVTFNYDRSLERYLLVKTCRQFDFTEEQAMPLLKKSFPVIHVHGSVGWIWYRGRRYLPYGSRLGSDVDSTVRAAREIRLVTDELAAEDDRFAKAKKLIDRANLVHFIGFHYRDKNMERLGFEDWTPGSRDDKLFGTVKGLSEHDIGKLYKKYALNRYSGPNISKYSLALDFRKDTGAFDYINCGPIH